MAGDELSMCEGCHRMTRTVLGKCPACWYLKTPTPVAPRRRHASPWDDDDLWRVAWALFTWGPAVAAAALGLVFDIPLLVFIGGGLILLRVFAAFLWTW
jgi:hypothetical protein